MVASVTGNGLGLERSSGFVLGSRGMLGDAAVGRLGGNVTVNAASGNLVIQNQDEVLIGLGPDDVLSRTYNSLGLANDDNGDNWRESSQRAVVLTSGTLNAVGSTVTRTGWDGSNVVYAWDATRSAYVAKEGAGSYDTISYAANVWTWTDGDSRVVEKYDYLNAGRITSSTDTDGNALTFTYTGTLLTKVTTADGNHTDLSYTGNNLTQIVTSYTDIATSTTRTLTRVRYGYDASNRLTTVTTDLTPGDNSITDGKTVVTTYTYDPTSGRVASISETGSTNTVQFTYVLVGTQYRVQTVTENAASGDARTTSFAYNITTRVTTITDALGKVTTMTYDAANNLTQITYPAATAGAAAQVVSYAYNANGDVVSATDAGGKTIAYAYDGNGNLTQERDAAGNTIGRTYGSKNELLTETHYLVPDPDGAGASTASSPVTTRYAYDAKNHLRFAVSAEGDVSEYQYNALGQLVSTIQYTANAYSVGALAANASIPEATLTSWAAALADRSTVERTDTSYDFRGNVATVTSYSAASASGAGLTTSPYTRTNYAYDQFGKLISKAIAGIATTAVYTYDGLGRVLSSTDLTNATTVLAINDGTGTVVATLASGETQTSVYDAAGELVTLTEAGSGVTSETTTYKYDKLGRLRITLDATAHRDFTFYDDAGRKVGYMDSRGALSEYRYDAANRLVATIHYANILGSTAIASLYDASGHPTAATLASVLPATATTDLWSWNVYDNADRLIETIDGAGGATIYAYDGDSRLTQTTRYANFIAAATVTGYKTTPPSALVAPAANAASDQVTRNFYDNDGLLIGALDGDGALSRIVYDEAGRKIEVDGYAAVTTASLRAAGTFAQLLASVTATASPADQHSYDVYDDQGHLRFTLDANARPTEYAYDNIGNLLRTTDYGAPITASASYTLSYVQGQIGALNLVANAATRVIRAVYDGAGRKAYDIDAEGEVTAYVYDALSHVIKQTRYAIKYAIAGDQTAATLANWAATNANAADRVDRNVYDKFERLVYEVDAAGYVTEHQYDVLDRVIKDIRYPATYTVADGVTQTSLAAQIGALPAGAVVKTYAYDVIGNLIDSYDGNGVRTHYSYDAMGHLYSVIEAYGTTDAAETRSWFNGAGRVGGKVTAYGAAEAATTSYGYDGVGNLTSTTDARSNVTTRAYDNVGNMLTETVPLDLTTWAITKREYDAFGNVVKLTDPRGNAGYFYYDNLDRLTLQIDAEGYATETSYNIGDQAVSTKRYYARATGIGSVATKPTLTVDGKDELTSFTRDKLDRIIATADAEHYTESYVLNAFGDRIQVTNKLGGVTANVFDKRGLLIQETLPVGATRADGTVETANIVNKFSYDARGNRVQMIEAAGLIEQRTTSYTYDLNDRLIRKTGDYVRSGGSFVWDEDGNSPTQIYVYDKRGNVIASSDAAGAITLDWYDDNDRKTSELSPVGTLSTWTYDANGNVMTARVYGDTVSVLGGASALTSPTDPNSPAAMIYRLYDASLGRMPYQNEVTLWVNEMAAHSNAPHPTAEDWSHVETFGEDLGAFEVICGEIQGDATVQARLSQTDNTMFITQIYQATFGRSPDASEISVWLGNMAAGWTRAGVLAFFCEHNCHRSITQPLILQAIAGGAASTPVNAANYRETTFTYDKNNRLLTSNVAGVVVGSYNGTNYATATQAITTQTAYDAAGNIIQQIDANGKSLFTYYDKNGRKTAQVDQGKYLTTWQLDDEGNTLSETRYATAIAAVVTAAAVPIPTPDATNDRTTTFTYDMNGRRRTETRLNVMASTVSGNSMATASTSAMITYSYNGLGEVLSKQEATGDTTSYTYDAEGRQTLVQGPSFTDYAGATVQQQLATSYDGLNNVARTVQNGARVTTYVYSIGGRLSSSKDPTGFTTNYYYDAVGRLVATTYSRLKSDGTSISDAKTTAYDAAGRIVAQRIFSVVGSAWASSGDTSETFYNAYGDTVAKGTNAGGKIANAQEFADYDKAGRVWRTNFGDGVAKAYLYDANGNATMLLQTTGTADLRNYADLNAVLAAPAGTTTQTISQYDARNKLTDTIQVLSNNTGAASVQLKPLDPVTSTGVQYFNSGASITGAEIAPTGATAAPIGSVSNVAASPAGSTQYVTTFDKKNPTLVKGVEVKLNKMPLYGGGNLHVVLSNLGYYGQLTETELCNVSCTMTDIIVNNVDQIAGSNAYLGYWQSTISVYQDAPGGVGRVLVSQVVSSASTQLSLNSTISKPATLQFQAESPNTASLVAFYRPVGSAGNYTYLGGITPLLRTDGSAVAGWYTADISALGTGNWDLRYEAFDGAGNVVDSRSVTLTYDGQRQLAPTTVTLTADPTYSSIGITSGTIGIATSVMAASVDLLSRPSGSTGAYTFQCTTTMVGTQYSPYMYASIDLNRCNLTLPSGTSTLDVQFVYRNISGNQLSTRTGTMSGSVSALYGVSNTQVAANGPGQVMATWDGPYYTLLFTDFPPNTQTLNVYYRNRTGGAWTVLGVNTTPRGGAYGQAGWWSARPPVDGVQYDYWIEPRDANGTLIGGRSLGSFVGGGQPSALTQYAEVPKTLVLSPPAGQAVTYQQFRYFSGGTWSAWSGYGAGGTWYYDAGALHPDFYANASYPIQYETYNGGTLVSHADATLNLGGGQGVYGLTNTQSVNAKVLFVPQQAATVSKIILYWRDKGATGLFTPQTITNVGSQFAWDVDAAGVRPASGSRTIEYYFDAYDTSGNLMATQTGADHEGGTLVISSDRYTTTTNSEIKWQLNTKSASNFWIHRKQGYNAFGEISSETDGRTDVTTFAYNTEGKLITKTDPLVNVTSEAGVTTTQAPVEQYYYDKSGRLVGQRDANGNLITQTLLAGTGYGGDEAVTTAEYHPAGATMAYGVDAFGDVRKITDALGNVTLQTFDAADRLTEVDHAIRVGGNSPGVQLKDHYVYDGLGQRIWHWNSQLGTGIVGSPGFVGESTDYDAEGRVVSTKSLGGQTTNYGYTWYNGSIIWTAGLGNYGGWQKSTSINGRVSLENTDSFGRLVWKQDIGGHQTGLYYNEAGELVHQSSTAGQNIDYGYYANGYISSITDNALGMKSTFEYDSDGNRTLESYIGGSGANSVYYQVAAVTYDAANRVTEFNDVKADIKYKYDAVGNRREVLSVYTPELGGALQTQDYWYKYDSANRFVLTMGALSGGVISTGTSGVALTYDAAGNRKTAAYGYDGHMETYSYTADGYLENMSIAGVVRAKRTYDAMGRVTGYNEYASNGTTSLVARMTSYDNDNRVAVDTSDTLSGSDTIHSVQSYDYKLATSSTSGYTGADQGEVTHIRNAQYTNSDSAHTVTTDTGFFYDWWDEAKQAAIRITGSDPSNRNAGSWAPGMSSLAYDVNGHIVSLTDANAPGGPRVVTYESDAYGQVMVSEEKDGAALGPRHLYYYFNGNRIGDVGNDGVAASQVDYAAALAREGAKLSANKSAFRNGKPVASADFDENYQPVNAQYPGAAASLYTVRSGDTLASIAQAAWGDASLWYLIADANGLGASSQLVAGQRLSIPNKVANVHDNSATFKVYDPGEAIGDTLPTLPNEPAPPHHHHGCGVFGQILLAVVAIGVTIVTSGAAAVALGQAATLGAGITAAAAGSLSLGAAVIGAVAGSVITQGIGIATGLQNKFSFAAVALAAVSAGVAKGLDKLGAFDDLGIAGNGVGNAAARGVVSDIATQGVDVAAGLQHKFDWTGVAAAGIGAGVGSFVGSRTGSLGTFGQLSVSGMASDIAQAATRSLIDGSDFGDNILAGLPSVIGQTIGGLIAARTASSPASATGQTGAGDGTAAPPQVGADGGQDGASATSLPSSDSAAPDDIIVTARRTPRTTAELNVASLRKALRDEGRDDEANATGGQVAVSGRYMSDVYFTDTGKRGPATMTTDVVPDTRNVPGHEGELGHLITLDNGKTASFIASQNNVTSDTAEVESWDSKANLAVGGLASLSAVADITAEGGTLGTNFKYYSSGWRGNQYVTTMEASKIARSAGAGLTAFSAGLDIYAYSQHEISAPHLGINLAIDTIGVFGGPVGAGIAIGYYAGSIVLDHYYPGGSEGLVQDVGKDIKGYIVSHGL